MDTEEKAEAEKQSTETPKTENPLPESGEPQSGQPEAGSREDEVKELNDKYIRLYAEFENFRRRMAKERVELIMQANKDLLLKLIPVVDDFDRAVSAFDKSDDLNALKEGVLLIYSKLKTTLQQSGVTETNSKGEPFDPELHDAITQIPAPTPDLKGKVVDEIQKGYFLNDKIIRHAKVVVGE